MKVHSVLFAFAKISLWLATGMNGGATTPKLKERRWVGYGVIPLDTPPLAAGSFIMARPG